MNKTKVLILGASGMLGHILLNKMSLRKELEVRGTVRNINSLTNYFKRKHEDRIYNNVSAHNMDTVKDVVERFKPDVIINAIGIIKQIKDKESTLDYLYVNSLFPHLLCQLFVNQCQIINVSTDCVFDGQKGMYNESDLAIPTDIYGMSKVLGEIYDNENVITIRTSIIGHELKTKRGLLEWFLNNKDKEVGGYTKAIYSGFTVIELENIISKCLIGKDLFGLCQLSSTPISKYDLLKIIKEIYSINIDIKEDPNFILDRSLDSSTEKKLIEYKEPSWNYMIEEMHRDYLLYRDAYEDKLY